MADSKISALPSSTTPLAGTEVLPIVQGGATTKVSVSNLTAGRSVNASGFTSTGASNFATAGGAVGIGTSSPAGLFQVATTTSAASAYLTNSYTQLIQSLGASGQGSYTQYWRDLVPNYAVTVGVSIPGGAAQSALVFGRYSGSWSEQARINSSGDFVISTAGRGITLPGGITWTSGSGSPEGVVTAPVGSLYSRSDGGALTSLYVKQSGSGNTGWAGK